MNQISLVEQIRIQIDAAFARLQLASPNYALWSGPAARTLEGTLGAIRAELHFLFTRLEHR